MGPERDLLPLTEEEEAFKGAVRLLFGDSFKRRMKDHLESLKCLRQSMALNLEHTSFFRGAAPTTPHMGLAVSEEEAKVRNSTRISQEEEKDQGLQGHVVARKQQ